MGTSWYLINCVAGVELDLLNQCRYVCEQKDFPKTIVEKFVVPTERHLRSHGDKRKVVDVKVRYPGYLFCKIRLVEDVYEILQELELARSWMGTVNRKGHKKLPPAPLPLNEEEVKKFKGLEEAQELFEDMFGGDYTGRADTGADLLAAYKGYDVGQMVKVLSGNFEGEDGTVRRLKSGQLMVRMFTYGQTFDEWMDPDTIRPMTDLEVMRGMSGPTAPINQDQFDVSIGKKDPPMESSFGDDGGAPQTSGLLQNAGIAPGRNRREDRVARGETGPRDMFGRTAEDMKKEEQNWLEYREKQRAGQGGGERDVDAAAEQVVQPKKKKDGPPKGKDTWGIVERSSWTGGEYGFEADSEQEERERRFRTSQSYEDRPERGGRGGRGRDERGSMGGRGRGGSERDERDRRPAQDSRGVRGDRENDWVTKADDNSAGEEDDFFNSLMSELSDDLSGDGSEGGSRSQGSARHDNAGPNTKPAEKSGGSEDSFFENLMSELGGALDEPSPSSSGNGEKQLDDDDFFSSLEAELSQSLGDGNSGSGIESVEEESSVDNDFFSSLQKEMGKALDESPERVDEGLQDDFFSSLIDDVADELETPAKVDEEDDFFSNLIDDVMDDVADDIETPAKAEQAPQDDFFSSLIDDVAEELKTSAKAEDDAPQDDFFSSLTDDAAVEETGSKQTSLETHGDLKSLTVPVLKELLRSKGLKVGGKKAELIERLQSQP